MDAETIPTKMEGQGKQPSEEGTLIPLCPPYSRLAMRKRIGSSHRPCDSFFFSLSWHHEETRTDKDEGNTSAALKKLQHPGRIYTMVTLFPKAANQCSKSWGYGERLEEQVLGQPSSVVGKGREGTQDQGSRERGRFPSGVHSRVPAATVNRRTTNPAKGAAEPLLWAPPFVGYCPILLRSWWPAAPPAKLAPSSQ